MWLQYSQPSAGFPSHSDKNKFSATTSKAILHSILSSDLALLWLWCRPAATAPFQALAWKLPYVMGAALPKKKKADELQNNLFDKHIYCVWPAWYFFS